MKMRNVSQRSLFLLLLLSFLPYFFALNLDVIDIDSSQYAEIGREMIQNHSWTHIKDNGFNYLDKPILTFWKIKLSYLVFGISNFSYRFPALLFTLLSIYSVYRITVLISEDKKRGLLAALMYSTAPGLYAMNVDPKIDVYLTAYLVFIHHFYYLGVKKNKYWFLIMYLMMGLGFVTKGPIAMVIPGISIGGDILFRRDWKRLREMMLPAGVPIAILPPLLWSLCLYRDFSIYGPHFFLWIQSFGRFYRKMYNQSFNPLFFFTNFGWEFALFFAVLVWDSCIRFLRFQKSKGILSLPRSIKENLYKNEDFVIPFWVFVYLFLISFSRFHLPQYTFWILPGAAIYTSGIIIRFLEEGSEKRRWAIRWFIPIASLLLLLFPVLTFDAPKSYYILLISALVVYTVIHAIMGEREDDTLVASVYVSSLFLLVVSLYIYPLLLSYQPSKEIGEFVRKEEPGEERIFLFGVPASKRSYAFYARRFSKPVIDPDVIIDELEKDNSRIVVVGEKFEPYLKDFLGKRVRAEKIRDYQAYKVATPKGKFFLKQKRPGLTETISLYRVYLR